MKNVKVGQVVEWLDDTKLKVLRVHESTVDLDFSKGVPKTELVDLGNGRVIWNHE